MSRTRAVLSLLAIVLVLGAAWLTDVRANPAPAPAPAPLPAPEGIPAHVAPAPAVEDSRPGLEALLFRLEHEMHALQARIWEVRARWERLHGA